jgi:hypothetical protein
VIEEREGAMAHRRRRILPVMPADVQRSDERFRDVLVMDLRRGKGGWERSLLAI